MSSSPAAARTPGPRVRLVAQTQFLPLPVEDWEDVDWATDADGGEALVEFAGRACYQSWDKPRASTATNAGFLRHVIDVGHTSVLEHGVVTMYLTGLSQAVAHELVRHRHFSFSQLSPRFVPDDSTAYVEPAAIADDPELHALFTTATDWARAAYDEVREALARRYADLDNSSVRAKQARQAARALLPAALETRIVVTGNYRAWRHFVAMRATDQADLEMRALAVRCLELLQSSAPGVFADFVVSVLADGSRVATSPLVVD